mgnify:CR=1 FL=1
MTIATRTSPRPGTWADRATARFLGNAPLGFSAGDTNLYRYVGNSPTNFTDPSGMRKYRPDQFKDDMEFDAVDFFNDQFGGPFKNVYWETFKKGCVGLCQCRFESYKLFPHLQKSTRCFTNLDAARAYQDKMEKEAADKKIDVIYAIFAVQTSQPLREPNDPIFENVKPRKPEFKDEIDPRQINLGGDYNFATYYQFKDKPGFWEYMNNGLITHDKAKVKWVKELPGFKTTTYCVAPIPAPYRFTEPPPP